MRLREIMAAPVVTIGPEETADAAWSRMEHERVRHLIVVDGQSLVGVLSERDLGGRDGGSVRRGRTAAGLMTSDAAVATPETTLRQAANLMSGRLIGCLPVVDDEDRVVGIVTATDVLEELGRGSTRPTVRAQRQSMRLPPAGARAAERKRRTRGPGMRTTSRVTRGGGAQGEGVDGGDGGDGRDGREATVTTDRVTPARERERRPDSAKRAPLPKALPRSEKRVSGRTMATETPAHIRSVGGVLDAEDRAYLRRKLGLRLGKFAPAIERTSVRVEDVNGPRGGIDKTCRIKIVLSGLPSVVVEERHQSVQAAMDGALAKVERAVRQQVQRRRAKPLRQ